MTNSDNTAKLPRSKKHKDRQAANQTKIRPTVITIKALHTAVRGRARIHINVLYHQTALSTHLTRQLAAINSITAVRANTLTGNVIINYDVAQTLDEILVLVKEAVRQAVTQVRKTTKDVQVKPVKSSKTIGDIITALIKAKFTVSRQQLQQKSTSLNQFHGDMTWHATSTEKAIDIIGANLAHGLRFDEATARLEKYGRNELPTIARRSEIAMLLEQFLTLPVGMLAASAVVSVVTGGLVDAAIIMSVVFINAGIGFFTERQAEKTISSLTKTGPRYAHVFREGDICQIPHAEVAVGDLLILNPGDFVAADARLIKEHRLTIDESALTGESIPVRKSSGFTGDPKTPIGDRINMVHRGTMVTGGSGKALVTGTGVNTEIGRIQSMVGTTRPPETPMQLQLENIGTQLAVISSVVCASVFAIGILRGQGFLQMLKSSISLAVAAVPEGLPAVATTTLALGIREMHQHHVAVRHLNAVETLGSVQVFCLDKTGTLTLNKMSVVSVNVGLRSLVVSNKQFIEEGEVVDPHASKELVQFLQVVALCNESEIHQDGEHRLLDGSPTENALMELASNAGINISALRQQFPRTKIRYRAEDRPYMYTHHQLPGRERLVAVKGSPQQVLDLCQYYLKNGRRQKLTHRVQRKINAANDVMASDALRILGVAYARQSVDAENKYENLTWLGLAGMIDPLRTGMPDLIHTFHQAGIRTVMITGDQSATAYAIGKQLNLSNNQPLQILDSTRLDKLDPDLLKGVIDKVHVFARVSPAHKLQIVQSFQQSGHVVAMTGDGINDGPALKASDIGVAMGGASTDVARSVSDVVLEDDNLHTMVTAVHEGRAIYNNIRKSIHYLISTNLSEIAVMLAGVGMGVGQPLNPMQLLWINLVTDIFPGLALSMEKPEPDLLSRPPRDPREKIIRRQDLTRMIGESTLITGGSIASYLYAYRRYGTGAQANTHMFNTLTIAQLLHAFSCRSAHYAIFSKERLPRNPYLTSAFGGSMCLQLLAMSIPGIRSILGSTTVGWLDSLVIGMGAAAPMLINESIKEVRIRKQGLLPDETKTEPPITNDGKVLL